MCHPEVYGPVDQLMDYVALHKRLMPDEQILLSVSQWVTLARIAYPDYHDSVLNMEQKELWGVKVKLV